MCAGCRTASRREDARSIAARGLADAERPLEPPLEADQPRRAGFDFRQVQIHHDPAAHAGTALGAPEGTPEGTVEDRAQRQADRIAQDPTAAMVRGGTGAAGSLSPSERSFFEPRFGLGLGDVKLHRDARAAELAGSVQARAFTRGSEIFFGAGQYAPGTHAGTRLLAHELAHVTQIKRGQADAGVIHRDPVSPDTMKVSGDAERNSPKGGVAIAGGTLEWTLKFVGDAGTTSSSGSTITLTQGKDVAFTVTYTPAKPSCKTIAFIQTVIPTHDGGPELGGHGNLLYTRDSKTGASVDALDRATTPYANAEAAPKGGLQPESNTTHQLGGTDKGRSASATYSDGPIAGGGMVPGGSVERMFETAPICVDTGETFGSVSWGYTKKADGTVTLTGATSSDVQSKTATPALEDVRQAFYAGTFQNTLGGFARGSSTLTSAHKTTLKAIAAQTPQPRKISLVGANDNSGGTEASAALSLERAQAAQKFLVDQGVSQTRITAEGIGVAARVQNPAGTQVPANRRVDIRLDYGETAPKRGVFGDLTDIKPLRRQDPRLTVDEVARSILDLLSSKGKIPFAQWEHLQDALDALDLWRKTDPAVPDLREIFKASLDKLRKRPIESLTKTEIQPVPHDTTELPIAKDTPPDMKADLEKLNESLRKYNEAKQKLEDMKQKKTDALDQLDEEKKILDEDMNDR
jgi:outer membrane protein OmpA-like peptidoglycan-associated protein